MWKLSRRNPDHAVRVQLLVGRSQVRVGNKVLKYDFHQIIQEFVNGKSLIEKETYHNF